jgi:DNA-binding transcriptional LysR family regulator
MDELDPHTLRVLRALADVGSITAAADRLGLSQPAVSQHLARAESRLGQALVVRSARGVTLTEAGQTLAAHAVHVQAALDAASEELHALGGLARGRVRIAGFPSASPTIVPRVLARLAAVAPGLTVSYVEAEPPEALAMLRDGTVDLAVTFTYEGDDAGPDPTLRGRAIGTDPLVLVTPAGPDGGGGGGGGGALAAHRDARWIGGCPRCRGHLLASCAASGFTPDIVLETDNAAAVLGLVAAGLGVALLPRLALATTIVPAGVRIEPVDDSLARRVEVVTGVHAARVPSIRAALDAVGTVSI